jgi:ABC-type Fe3+-hydroxamate transport system substrate-binding protein
MTIRSFFDQLGNQISLPFPPERIVSLVPSQTELLADLGLEQKVVGITKYCIHPSEFLRTKTVIGGTEEI